MQPLIVLEPNKINFDCLNRYGAQEHLPNLTTFFKRHGYVMTTSEQAYEELEPWIQWAAAHIEKSFTITASNKQKASFMKDATFIALKRDRHNGIGYFADSGSSKDSLSHSFPQQDMPTRIHKLFS